MIAFLIACAPFIPAILSVVSFLMKMFGSSERDIRAYEDMVRKMNASGRLSIESHDRLLANKDAILKRQKEKQDAAQAKLPPKDVP